MGPKSEEKECAMLEGGMCGVVKPGGVVDTMKDDLHEKINKRPTFTTFWVIMVAVATIFGAAFGYTRSDVEKLREKHDALIAKQEDFATKEDIRQLREDFKELSREVIRAVR